MAVDVVAVAAVLVSRFTSLAAISNTNATRFPASPIAYGIVVFVRRGAHLADES